MEQALFLALIAGSTINLAIGDVLDDRTVSKSSFLLNFFLILSYIFLFFGLIHAILFILFALILAVLNSKGYHNVGLGDASLYLVFLQFNPLLFFYLQVPVLLCFWLDKGKNIAYLPFMALYFTSICLTG